MKKQKASSYLTSVRLLELVFWILIIATAIFLNLSSHTLIRYNPVLLVVLFSSFLILIFSRVWNSATSSTQKNTYMMILTMVALLPVLLVTTTFAKDVFPFYFPALISLAMASLVVLEPRIHVVFLVSLCLFFLGDAYFGIQTLGAGFKYPMQFVRVFSLTLLTIFTYYFYTKEIFLQRKLTTLNERLSVLDRLKSEFMANVSHELRTPLTSIKNAAVLLKKKIDNQEAGISISDEELLNIILSNTNRQASLIDRLLDLSKLEKGKSAVPRTLVNIENILKDVVKSLAMQAPAKNITIVSDIEEGLPNIWASEHQITQVYTNLLDNAIKYNKINGKVIVHIRTVGNNIESIIEDTGIGISPENIGRLFEKFMQLEDSIEYRKKGVGLGLVISKEIIELHRGTIRVESELGVGTKFIFTLPRGLRESDKNDSQKNSTDRR